MRCSKCGVELIAGARFCQNCGVRIVWPGTDQSALAGQVPLTGQVPPAGPASQANQAASAGQAAVRPDPAGSAASDAALEAMRKAEQAEAARRALAAEKQKLTATIPNIQVQPTAQQTTTVQPRPTGPSPQTAGPARPAAQPTGSSVKPSAKQESKPAGKRSHKLVILLAVIGVLLLGAGAYFLFAPKTVRLSDYFTVKVDGADGYGSARLVWNEEKLAELNQMAARKNQSALEAGGGSMDKIISPSIRSDRPDGELRNGDIVNIRYPDLTAVEKDFRIRFRYFGAVEVAGLNPVTEINLLDHVVFSYEGYNGWGTGTARLDSESLTVGDLTVTLQQDADGDTLQFDLVSNTTGETASVIYGTDHQTDRLSNGSTVAYSLVSIEGHDGKWLGAHGVELITEERSFEAEGLAALEQVDLFASLTAEYTGFNTRGNVELKLDSDSFTAGGVTFALKLAPSEEDESTPPECWAEAETDDGFRIRLVPDGITQGTLENGQEILYRIPADEEEGAAEFLAGYGLEAAAAEKTFVVEGLAELQNVNVLDALNVSASGYNGYGILQGSLTEESAEAGEYTLRYALPKNAFGMDAAVVTEAGETLYTVSYRAEAASLKNGDTVTLKADPETLKKIDEECGIILPDSRSYTISGLKDTTEVEPRDYIKPVFTKKGDKITGKLTLTKDSFKAGEYTVRLSVQDADKGDKRKVVFTIVDATGKELAKGSYTLNNIGAAGTNATIDYNSELDPKTAAAAYGLIFKSESKEVKITVS